MNPATSAASAGRGLYPEQTDPVHQKLEPLYADWNTLMGEFRAEDAKGLALFLDRAFAKFEGDSEVYRTIFQQVAERLKTSLPPPAAPESLEPKNQIAVLAGDSPKARQVWINFCANRGFLSETEAAELSKKT